MKFFWEILAIICTFVIIIVLVTGFYEHLFGKILLGFAAGLLSSSIIKVIRKK